SPSRQIVVPDAAPSLFGCFRGGAAAHRARPRGNRLDDVVVAGAAANIAFELFTDGAIVELVAFAADNVDGRHDHAGRTEAALQSVIFAKRLLHRMQRTVRGRQTFDGQDVGAFKLQSQHGAGFDRLAVDVHYTGTALRRVTADMRTGEPQMLAQELHQKRALIDIGGGGLA